MLSIIEECFIDPCSENPSLSISNGIVATEKLVLDIFNVFKFDTERMDTFIEERCFQKSKDFPLVANRNRFAKFITIMQKCSIDLREVFKYSLGPFPRALAGSIDDLRKNE